MMNSKAIFSRLRHCRMHLLLMLLAWQGPVPICHAHGTLATDSLNSPELAGHLVQAHSDLNPTADIFFDWHWHWVLPCELASHPGSTDHEQSNQFPGGHHCHGEWESSIILANDTVAEQSWSERWYPLPEFTYANTDLTPALKLGLPSHFLQNFAAELSLPQRLSVYRC